jgi:hypothetical protein
VAGDRFADHRPGAVHDVEDARRDPRGRGHLGEQGGGERGEHAGLEHHRATGEQRRRDLRDCLIQGGVPRRDRADDADRLAHEQRVAQFLLPGEAVGHRGEAARHLVGQPGLHDLGVRDRRTHLGGDGGGEVVDGALDAVGDPGDRGGPLTDRHSRPRRERALRGRDSPVDVGRRTRRHVGDHGGGGRVHDLDALAPVAGGFGAVDPMLDSSLFVHASISLLWNWP